MIGQLFSEKGKEPIEQTFKKAKEKIQNIKEEIKLTFIPVVASPFGNKQGDYKGLYVVRIELTPSQVKGCSYMYN